MQSLIPYTESEVDRAEKNCREIADSLAAYEKICREISDKVAEYDGKIAEVKAALRKAKGAFKRSKRQDTQERLATEIAYLLNEKKSLESDAAAVYKLYLYTEGTLCGDARHKLFRAQKALQAAREKTGLIYIVKVNATKFTDSRAITEYFDTATRSIADAVDFISQFLQTDFNFIYWLIVKPRQFGESIVASGDSIDFDYFTKLIKKYDAEQIGA